MKITSFQKNDDRNTVTIYVENKPVMEIDEEDYLRLHLYEKQEISNDELSKLKESIDFRYAKSKAVKFASLKLRCENEIRNKLLKNGYSSAVIERTIEELRSTGYINDKLYVENYINDRCKLKPQSKNAIKYNLLNIGIDEKIIDQVIESYKFDEFRTAYNLAKKKFGRYNINDDKIKRKLYSFLSYRGFNHEIINAIIIMLKNNEDME